MNKRIKILVVLCPGHPVNDQFVDLAEDKFTDHLIYTGGSVRMIASAYEATRYSSEYRIVFVIGGSENKVVGMKNYLIDRGISEMKIIRIESAPSTQGNLYALKKTIGEASNKLELKILTSQHHKERVSLMAQDILGEPSSKEISWKVLSAEKILSRSGFPRKPKILKSAFNLGIYREKRGCWAWRNGLYFQQSKNNLEGWKTIIHDLEIWQNFKKEIFT